MSEGGGYARERGRYEERWYYVCVTMCALRAAAAAPSAFSNCPSKDFSTEIGILVRLKMTEQIRQVAPLQRLDQLALVFNLLSGRADKRDFWGI